MAEQPESATSNPSPEHPPLEVFPAYPCFWKPSQISGCWRVVGDKLQHIQPVERTKELLEENNAKSESKTEIETSLQEFVQDLDFEEIKHQILGHTNNWQDALNDHDPALGSSTSDSQSNTSRFYYMTTSYKKGKIQSSLETILRLPKLPEKQTALKKKKIQDERNQLLKNHNCRLSNLLIYARHKLVHTVDLPPDGLSALDFLTADSTGENSKGFVQILITAFPKLVPFVGIKRGTFSTKENTQDLDKFGDHKDKFSFDLKSFLDQLKRALDYNMMKGGLEKRYQGKLSAGSLTLEFRKPNQSLEFYGDNTTGLAAIISKSSMKIIWSGIKDVHLTYTLSDNKSLENTCIIFSKTETDSKVDQHLVTQCTGKRIIIVDKTVANVSEIVNIVSEKFNCKLEELEVNWEDLRQCNGESYAFTRNVYFHKLKVPIHQILSEQELESFVKELKGDELNKFLKGQDFQIFDKYEKPSLFDFYIEREFLEKVVIKSDTLTMDMQIEHDIFIICGIEYKDAKRWFPGNQTPLIIQKGKTDWFKHRGLDKVGNRIVLIEDSMEWSADIFEIIGEKNWFQTYSIHCFKHMKQNALTWIGSKGNDSILNEICGKCLKTNQCKRSEDCLVDAALENENIRAIILSGVPGSGKSEAMNKIANTMFAKYEVSIVAVIKIEEFVEKLRKILANDELCISTVVNTLAELGCESYFKKKVAKKVLLSSQTDAKAIVKVELMFDGLDEARKDSRDLLIETVKYIIEHMPAVRIWISIRDHLVHELENLTQTVHVTMIPFSRIQQTDFVFGRMHQYIQEYRPSEGQVVTDAELKALAKECTNMKVSKQTIDIAGIPLHCYLISQFYAEKALQNDFSIDENSPTLYQLYKNVFCQKFLIYHRKVGVNLQKSHLELPVYKDINNYMLRRHIYCALKLFYCDEWAEWGDWFQQKLYVNEEDLEDLASLVLPYGLIQSLEPIRFLHLTFAESLVAFFIRQLITKQLENRVSSMEAEFLEFAKRNILCIDKIPGKEDPNFKNPSIAYFLYAGLASYIAQTSSSFDEKEKNETQLSKATDDCKIMNDEIVEFIFSIIPQSEIPDSYKKKRFRTLFDVRVAPCFPLQNLFMLLYQKRQLEFCKHIILLGKRSSREVVPWLPTRDKLKLITEFFTSEDLTLFQVRPNLNTKELIRRKLLSANDNWLAELKIHVTQLLLFGNLEDNSLLDWVQFLLYELKNTENERKQADKNVDAAPWRSRSEVFLWCAVNNKTSNSKIIEYLCKLGLDVNMPNSIGRTPLMDAAKKGRIDLVETLLSQAADISLEDRLEGNSIFYYAAESGSVVLMQTLIHKDPKLFKEKGVSILRGALESGSVPILEEFVLPEFEHLVSELRTDFWSTYKIFVLGDKSEIIRECAKKYLNVNFCNEDGDTPLHVCLCSPDQKDAAIALLNAEADIHAINKNGKCPVYTCLINCSLEVTREIVRLEPDYSSGRECMCKLHTFIRENYAHLNQVMTEKMRLFVSTPASKLPGKIYIKGYDPELLYYALLYLLFKMVATQMPDEALGYLYLLASSDSSSVGFIDYDDELPWISRDIRRRDYFIDLLNLIESPEQNKERLSKYIKNH